MADLISGATNWTDPDAKWSEMDAHGDRSLQCFTVTVGLALFGGFWLAVGLAIGYWCR